MITELTEDQKAMMPLFVDRWTKVGLSTQPANREKAESAIRLMYECGDLPPPQQIVWFESPFAMCLGRSLLLNRDISKEIIGAETVDGYFNTIDASPVSSISIDKSLWPALIGNDTIRDGVRRSVSECIYGHHEAGWLSFYSYFREACGLVEQTNKLRGLFELAENAGWALPFPKCCFVSERPIRLLRDDRARLHNKDGMAIEYPDGFGIYAIHGVKVPDRVITDPKSITATEIENEANAEVRRVMMELYGYERFFEDSDAQFLMEDEFGKLYRKTWKDADREPSQFVLVVNSTPEPDGTSKLYTLQVPPTVSTAASGVAWTFGLDEETYKPLIQT